MSGGVAFGDAGSLEGQDGFGAFVHGVAGYYAAAFFGGFQEAGSAHQVDQAEGGFYAVGFAPIYGGFFSVVDGGFGVVRVVGGPGGLEVGSGAVAFAADHGVTQERRGGFRAGVEIEVGFAFDDFDRIQRELVEIGGDGAAALAGLHPAVERGAGGLAGAEIQVGRDFRGGGVGGGGGGGGGGPWGAAQGAVTGVAHTLFISPAEFELVGARAGCQRIECQTVFQRGEGAASAVGAVAETAGEADADCGGWEVDSVGVDEIGGVADVAAHGEDVDGGWFAPAGGGLLHGAGEAEEGGAVGELGDLDAGGAGGGEGGVDDPAGAGSAEAGEGEAGGGEAFGDVSGGVHAEEEEGDAAGAGALEGAEAVAGLFEADAEAGGEGVHVVAEGFRGGEERCVGHEDAAGDVVEEGDADELFGFWRGWGCEGDHFVHGVACFEEGELEGQVEAAAFAGEHFGEHEAAGFGVVAAEGVGERAYGDGDAVAAAEAFGDGVVGFGGLDGEFGGEGFGGFFEAGEVVGVFVEEVSHFLGGEEDSAAGWEGDAAAFVPGDAEGAVEGEEGAGGGGGCAGEVGEFGVGHGVGGEEGVGEDFAELGFDLAFGGAGEGGEIDGEGFGDLDEEGGGDGALVVLDEVEVAGGDAEAEGEGLLGHGALGSQAADGAADSRAGHL
jgi:hypothetical protein